jgi:hypothetical protein
MPNRIPRQSGSNGDQSHNVFLAPVLAFSMWNPLLASALGGNAQAQEGFGTIASEWQDFVQRRLKEDLALMQRLAHGGTPDQILAAYSDFWQKAAEDYGKEFTTMSRLMAAVTVKTRQAA